MLIHIFTLGAIMLCLITGIVGVILSHVENQELLRKLHELGGRAEAVTNNACLQTKGGSPANEIKVSN